LGNGGPATEYHPAGLQRQGLQPAIANDLTLFIPFETITFVAQRQSISATLFHACAAR
jgi:hypothetical protein